MFKPCSSDLSTAALMSQEMFGDRRQIQYLVGKSRQASARRLFSGLRIHMMFGWVLMKGKRKNEVAEFSLNIFEWTCVCAMGPL